MAFVNNNNMNLLLSDDFLAPAPVKRRPLDDFNAKPALPEMPELSDHDSLDNNTNLNWRTGKRKKQKRTDDIQIAKPEKQLPVLGEEREPIASIPLQEFYASSHYFIDQLKDEYFESKEDDWFEAKPVEHNLAIEQQQAKSERKITKPVRWSDEEHRKFLEALRLFGKDWPKVTRHIGTRSSKNVVSHGQKFLVRLIEFLDQKAELKELSVEEAEYYVGILNKKQNRSTLEKERRDELTKELKQKGFLFRVEKGKRRTKRCVDETCSNYERWKKEVLGDDAGSFRGSLGHSVKIAPSSHGTSKRLSFKSKFQVTLAEVISDTDSAASQSVKHLKKFRLDGDYQFLEGTDFLNSTFFLKIKDAFLRLGDLKHPSEEVDLVVKIKDIVEFKVFQMQSMGTLLNPLSQRNAFAQQFAHLYPNLYRHFRNVLESRMDNDELNADDKPPVLKQLLEWAVQPDKREFISSLEISFEYKPRNVWHEDWFKLPDLEVCTNFKHTTI